ncbi:MAG: hypothetical protein KJ614_00120 [Gammaproteobacteria bacterium]|uniref:hypothetical protein n=1 Tax=Rhodoferax sp. TaxID=50421 RepID=UPI0017901120|nr:hypothetical protein [Rhodoferax sp.]MBU3897330.1 hypothetical protein [Gammaproteobacteria bacterium]MBA3057231.1 hypothetical protein [Rhodoferax sp.]MBU3998298.1 hypothetical protein [Gammaproteobacteria bacterium]MBU4018676.1 hypothetical protein [Gammaproteobacteria bacterium]MBU4079631.1 hypothetical protein [Gammaproteobacteria bacterium]
MNSRSFKQAVAAFIVGGLLLLVMKLFVPNFGKAELGLSFCGLLICGVVAFRFQQRRERRQLDLMRDSALW